ncbi:Protein toll [Mizuhopecten yessoensis]|uniref:Protein toll n=1 Tax=Mizuhopecten yessoensis TaxID=6573 RepID=A0A210PZ15_MIZYE|nr:Protein toll [Mizuhopecten yessoensis]
MECSEHGICEKFSNGSERCHCDTNYEGRLCDIGMTFDEPDSDLELTPFVVIPIVLVLLFLAAGLLLFWMWKNRVTIIMKIVHYFQAYEDDDEKIWDVFISYKSADIDQTFVLRVLLPKLEELGFTVCLHFREFLPGESIANNIINAINNSRRTILILTPRYVSSEFTRLEYQVAQHEMLKRKHKIIPVLLEDISMVNDTMDPNLKLILRCVTYLEYPGPDAGENNTKRFWEKLSLAMPKKRQTEEKQKQQIDEITDELYIEGPVNGATTKNEKTHTVDTHV